MFLNSANYESTIIKQLARHVINGEYDEYEYKVAMIAQEGDIGTRSDIESKVDYYIHEYNCYLEQTTQ